VGGTWYLSTGEASLKAAIDRFAAREKEPAKKGEKVEVNTAFSAAPQAAVLARDGLRRYLEWESHHRALGSAAEWYPLFRAGLLPEDLTERTMRDEALRYLGYVPVSPEGAGFRYDPVCDEVVNERHGSLRQPNLRAGVEDNAPLYRLLEEFCRYRAE